MYYRAFIVSFFVSISLLSQEISGDWSGNLEMGGYQLKLSFKILKDSLGYSCFMSIPQQNVENLKIKYVSFEDSTLTIRQTNINFEFIGRYGTNYEINGDFIQNGVLIPLTLKHEPIIFQRLQKPTPPFNYSTEDFFFTNSEDNVSLAGTLTIPKDTIKFPLAIIIGGSGPQNRDGEIMGHKPFLIMADYLSNNGIGVLRFDERGTGKSSGNYNYTNIETITSDVIAALDYIKSRKGLNPNKIGLIGHSLGGIIASKVAPIRKEINFLIFLATPAIPGDELMLLQKATIEENMGVSKQQIESNSKIFAEAYSILNQFKDNASLKDTITSYLSIKLFPTPPNKINDIVNQLTSNDIIDILQLHPSKYLSKVSCPVLALNGDRDLQVDSEINLKALEIALQLGENHMYKVIEFKGLNHLFQESATGLPNEYFEIEQTIAPKVLEEITKWILQFN